MEKKLLVLVFLVTVSFTSVLPVKPCIQLCVKGRHCVNGVCVPIEPVPVDPCATVRCREGYICKNGDCIKDNKFCRRDKDCPYPESCVNNECFNKCSVVKCRAGYECEYGNCIDMCLRMDCKKGYTCFEGNCIPQTPKCRKDSDCKKRQRCEEGVCVDKCANIMCAYGGTSSDECCSSVDCVNKICPPQTICKSGQCVLDFYPCPTNFIYHATVCKDPRPDDQTCPNVVYIRAPDPLYCGVTTSGNYVNFPRQCEACKDKSIVFYFDTPCQKAPLGCKKGSICDNQKVVCIPPNK